VQFGFERLDAGSIVSIVHPDNAASRRVLTKLGMLFIDARRYFGIDVCRYRSDRSGVANEEE